MGELRFIFRHIPHERLWLCTRHPRRRLFLFLFRFLLWISSPICGYEWALPPARQVPPQDIGAINCPICVEIQRSWSFFRHFIVPRCLFNWDARGENSNMGYEVLICAWFHGWILKRSKSDGNQIKIKRSVFAGAAKSGVIFDILEQHKQISI